MIPQILHKFFINAHVYFTNHFYNKVHRMKKEKGNHYVSDIMEFY